MESMMERKEAPAMAPEPPAEVPDTYGLQEFFVSELLTEIDGPNVRTICGVKRSGSIHWLYCYVMRADLLAEAARQIEKVASEALDLLDMVHERSKSH
jgi:hypothetical protein